MRRCALATRRADVQAVRQTRHRHRGWCVYHVTLGDPTPTEIGILDATRCRDPSSIHITHPHRPMSTVRLRPCFTCQHVLSTGTRCGLPSSFVSLPPGLALCFPPAVNRRVQGAMNNISPRWNHWLTWTSHPVRRGRVLLADRPHWQRSSAPP